MKSLVSLWRVMAMDLAMTCCTSADRDFKTVAARVEQEGVSFLTITLPTFGKEFERALDQGCVDASSFPGFSRKGGLPAFLQGFLRHVFDSSGRSLIEVSPEKEDLIVDSIFAIRQLCFLFSKIELPCSDARTARAMKGYLDCEMELSEKRDELRDEDLEDFRRIASLVYRGPFTHMDNLLHAGDLRGRHGPGSTADGLLGNKKYDQRVWTWRLEEVFPSGDHLVPNGRHYDHLNRVQFLEPEAEMAVKVISVPKTLKTPRIIAVEPTCMQYMQQALLEPLIEVLERRGTLLEVEKRPNLTGQLMGFSDQNPNRDLARIGSIKGDLATLDLSEASDRVLNELVLALLHRNPLFSRAVQATRSTSARVSVGTAVHTVELTKFASMGSALCFPFEAMVFLTAILMGIERSARVRLTYQSIKALVGRVRVYGDDLVVPVEHVPAVIATLEALGFKVNGSKSFWTGKFRESCGGDYYSGHDVTPVKFRRAFPESRHQVEELQSLVSFRNHVYHRGMWSTARYLDGKIRGLLRDKFPIVESTAACLGRESIPFRVSGEGWSSEKHVPVVQAYVPRHVLPASKVSGTGALQKFFLRRGDEPFQDPEHLQRGGRPQASSIYLRWVQPF